MVQESTKEGRAHHRIRRFSIQSNTIIDLGSSVILFYVNVQNERVMMGR